VLRLRIRAVRESTRKACAACRQLVDSA
jgi:hypothetical protein